MDTPALTRHQRRRLQTRKQLTDAALQLILERGYDAITIQDITERADLGRGTFYIHFKDKEEVVWAMFREMFDRLEQQAHRQIDRSAPGVEYYGFRNIFEHAAENRDLYRVVFGGKGSAALTERIQNHMAAAFLEDIHSAPPAGGVDFHLPEEFEAQILTGAVGRLLFWWLETPNDYSAGQMAAMLYEAIYRKPTSG
jgi:AcrR family transcriptional regulator